MFCFIDYRTSLTEKLNLSKLHLEPLLIPRCKLLYPAIDGHVDIQVNILNKKEKSILVHRDIDMDFKITLEKLNFNIITSTNSLTNRYPNNVFLNAFQTEDYFVHNLSVTDKRLLELQSHKKLIDVKQGYTKCSILPVREKAVITSDIGISNALLKENFDVLLLSPGDIVLQDFNYGFIGGVGGKISDDSIAFFGTLDKYIYGDEVKRFLYKYDVEPKYLSNTKLIDRGSILTL